MSHQTGIKANEELKKLFVKCRNGKIRIIKISIKNEELTLAGYKEVEKSWDKDYDKMVLPCIEPEQPTFILYRLDSKDDSTGYDWLLISWSPDDSPVRQKMLYASTKATLKQEFGSAYIKEELHGTVQSEVTLRGLQNNRRITGRTPAPLTPHEEELAELRKVQNINLSDVSIGTRSPTLSSVSFPITKDVVNSLKRLTKKDVNYIQLQIDIENEKIHLVHDKIVTADRLSEEIPTDGARYHLYNFKHKFDGNTVHSIVFIYSMPGYSCSVKERMLYSSCKGYLIDAIEHELGRLIDKKLEIDSGDELNEKFLIDEIHPPKISDKPKFEKPKGPLVRGAKRLTKIQNSVTTTKPIMNGTDGPVQLRWWVPATLSPDTDSLPLRAFKLVESDIVEQP